MANKATLPASSSGGTCLSRLSPLSCVANESFSSKNFAPSAFCANKQLQADDDDAGGGGGGGGGGPQQLAREGERQLLSVLFKGPAIVLAGDEKKINSIKACPLATTTTTGTASTTPVAYAIDAPR